MDCTGVSSWPPDTADGWVETGSGQHGRRG